MNSATLSKVRRSVSAKMRGLEIPACFTEATVASEALILARPTDGRRLADQSDLKRAASKTRRLEK